MKNKGVLIAGLGLGAALTLSVLSFSSANETSAIDEVTSTATAKKIMLHGDPSGMGMHMGKGDKFMIRMGGPARENTAIQAALQSNDYAAFTAATKGTPMEGKVTQEQFNEMVVMEQKRQTIETAIENNDYSAYVAATTPTREEFDQIVSQRNTHKAIEAAIETKDYAAFQKAIKDTPMAEKIMTEDQFNQMIEKRAEKAASAATKNK